MGKRYKVVRLNCKLLPMSPEEIETLAKVEADVIQVTGDEIRPEDFDIDALMVIAAKVPGDVINKLSKCRVIARLGIGTDKIDIDTATKNGIIVTNVPDFCDSELADHTMALMLGVARRLLELDKGFRETDSSIRGRVNIQRLAGKKLGLIGFGRLAREVAKRSVAFGLEILFYDPFVSGEDIKSLGAKKIDSLEEIMRECDIISLHLPLNPDTKHLINENLLSKMKPSAILINTARGAVVDEDALEKALKEGWLSGAGIDVFEHLNLFEEVPTKQPCPFFLMDNVIVTPHAASQSKEAFDEVRLRAAEEVARVLSGQTPKNIVNPKVRPRSI